MDWLYRYSFWAVAMFITTPFLQFFQCVVSQVAALYEHLGVPPPPPPPPQFPPPPPHVSPQNNDDRGDNIGLDENFTKRHSAKHKMALRHSMLVEHRRLEDLTEKRDRMEEVFGEVDDWEIYEKVIREHRHGHAFGLGVGAKLKDINSHKQTCTKLARLELKENYEIVKGEVETLKDKLEKLTQVVQNLLPHSSDNSKSARKSHYVVQSLPY
ncbi:hypothetical protein ACLB2K_073429 [Fragaria x ananassa]